MVEVDIAAAAAGVACGDPALMCWMNARPGLASWAQFAGGLLAVVAAFMAGHAPIAEQRRVARRRDGVLIGRILDEATNATRFLRWRTLGENPEIPRASITRLGNEISGAADQIDALRAGLQDPILDARALSLQRSIRSLGKTLKRMAEHPDLEDLKQALVWDLESYRSAAAGLGTPTRRPNWFKRVRLMNFKRRPRAGQIREVV